MAYKLTPLRIAGLVPEPAYMHPYRIQRCLPVDTPGLCQTTLAAQFTEQLQGAAQLWCQGQKVFPNRRLASNLGQ